MSECGDQRKLKGQESGLPNNSGLKVPRNDKTSQKERKGQKCERPEW